MDEAARSLMAGGAGEAEQPEAQWWKEEFDLPWNFMRDVRAIIKPGDSALFVLSRSAQPLGVLRELRNYGGMILHTPFSPEQDSKMEAFLKTVN